jgi:Fe-S cluster assembly protein SufD
MNLTLPITAAEAAYREAGVELSLPHRRMEDWRWTDLRQLIDRPYPRQGIIETKPGDIALLLSKSLFSSLAGARLVFVNGRFEEGYSKLAGLSLRRRSKVQNFPDEPLLQMNAALGGQGIVVRFDGNADVPTELLFITTAGAARTIASRNIIEVAAGASATIIETHIGEGPYLVNDAIEIELGERARLDRIKVEMEANEAIHLSHAEVTLGRQSTLRDFTFTSGARLNRQNGTYIFAGDQADAKIAGTYLISGRQHADTRLVVDHRVPSCTSRELFKCIIDDNARGIFQGKVIVQRGAQKTDGKQSSHGLLLSPSAEFDAKPELEIYADDVVCGHGATAGELDDDQLFYLCSRGLAKSQARALLVAAFAGEALDTIANDGVRERLAAFTQTWVAGRQ